MAVPRSQAEVLPGYMKASDFRGVCNAAPCVNSFGCAAVACVSGLQYIRCCAGLATGSSTQLKKIAHPVS